MPRPKFLGRDCELSTTGRAVDGSSISNWDVTRAVLSCIDSAFHPQDARTWSRHPMGRGGRLESEGGHARIGAGHASPHSSDCCRHWAPNGQCYYADLAHVELCTAETRDPWVFGAQSWAALKVVEEARAAAQDVLEPGTRLVLTTSNADTLDPGISFGQHLNLSIDSALWETLFVDPRRPGVLGFVSSALAAAVPFFGAGQILALEDGRALYSLSGRAHHLRRVICSATTLPFERGLLHDRREPHGPDQDRLHLIGFDASPLASVLTASFLQCVFAAAEAHCTAPSLADPLAALAAFSWDPQVFEGGQPTRSAELQDGRHLSLPAYVGELSEHLLRLVREETIPSTHAPGAEELLSLILELSRAYANGDLTTCARHLDWAAKGLYLRDLVQSEGFRLADAEMRVADHDFGSTEPEGVLQRLVAENLADPLLEPAAIESALRDGPADARGWARGRLIQQFRDSISAVDWGFVELLRSPLAWGTRLRVELADVAGPGRERLEPVLDGVRDVEALEGALAVAWPGSISARDPLCDLARELSYPRREDLGGGG